MFIHARSAVKSLQNILVTASIFISVNKKNLSAFGGVNRKPTILFIGLLGMSLMVIYAVWYFFVVGVIAHPVGLYLYYKKRK